MQRMPRVSQTHHSQKDTNVSVHLAREVSIKQSNQHLRVRVKMIGVSIFVKCSVLHLRGEKICKSSRSIF